MEPDFWHQRWHDNQIGFHQDKPTPMLLKHWPTHRHAAPGSRVFVPLAGKTLGHAVAGRSAATACSASSCRRSRSSSSSTSTALAPEIAVHRGTARTTSPVRTN